MADDPEIPTQFGWDASDYDWARGPMDLRAAAADGIVFFTHKATEAASTKHKYFGEAMRRARDARIPVLGAYHVVRSSPSIAAQVDFCVAYVDSQCSWWRDFPLWFWQVDLEKWPYDSVPASAGEAFADAIEAKTGRKAIIYASRGQYGSTLTGTSHELWNANYGNNIEAHFRAVYSARGGDSGAGWVAYSGKMPVFWQYGSRTTIGSQTICDANAFRGTLDQLAALIGGKTMSQEQYQSDMNTWQERYSTLNDLDTVSHLKDIWSGAAQEFPNAPVLRAKRIEQGVKDLLARPPVTSAPIDQAALDAAVAKAITDPKVLSAIAKAVTDEIGS